MCSSHTAPWSKGGNSSWGPLQKPQGVEKGPLWSPREAEESLPPWVTPWPLWRLDEILCARGVLILWGPRGK